MLTKSRPVTILVVDDDEGHCELIRRNLRRGGVANSVVVMHRGDAALDYLHGGSGRSGGTRTNGHGDADERDRQESGEERAQAPDRLLVLLDLNMPGGLNGLEVLRQIKSKPATRKVPVIVLTTTDDPREISRCYDLGCNVFITKPVDAQSFMDAITRLGLFVSIINLPPYQSDIVA
jgi:CheY-like chemotaxis protein